MTLWAAFLNRVVPRLTMNGDCWEWSGAKIRGYSVWGHNGKPLRLHRVVYELIYGEIPSGLVIDHLCSNPGCVNPDHLEAVTQQENVRRSDRRFGRNRTGHCRNGHKLTSDNVYIRPKNGWKVCKMCFNNSRVKSGLYQNWRLEKQK